MRIFCILLLKLFVLIIGTNQIQFYVTPTGPHHNQLKQINGIKSVLTTFDFKITNFYENEFLTKINNFKSNVSNQIQINGTTLLGHETLNEIINFIYKVKQLNFTFIMLNI
jgi:hypothetical protein